MTVRDDAAVIERCGALAAELKAAGVRSRLDARVDVSFGRRATDWELKGVPVRIEVGPRDLADGNVTIVRRDTREKVAVPVAEAAARVAALTTSQQADILAAATVRRDDRIAEVATIDEAREAAQVGFARVPWSQIGTEGEAALARRAPSPSAASSAPTAASPRARTSPTSSPTSPARTEVEAAEELEERAPRSLRGTDAEGACMEADA